MFATLCGLVSSNTFGGKTITGTANFEFEMWKIWLMSCVELE